MRDRIAAASAGRSGPLPRLIAVSKTKPVDMIEAALAAGQNDFGENRVQEASVKFPLLKRRYPQMKLHLIGPLQTNKLRQAMALFDYIHTLDREKLARAIATEQAAGQAVPALLIQVNTGEEPQKSGVWPGQADAFITLCRNDLNLPIRGLMCIPPAAEEPSPHFALLAKIAARHGLAQLSMGMSGDYEIAAAFGATMLRVGSAIFGERQIDPVTI